MGGFSVWWRGLGVLFLVFGAPCEAQGPTPSSIRVAFGDSSPPVYWSTSSNGLRGSGLVVDLVGELSRVAGWPLEAEWLPLARVQNLVAAGELDAMVNVVTPARLEYAVASRSPLFTSPVKIFVRKDSPFLGALQKVRTLDELSLVPVSVGALLGSGWTKTNLEARGMKVEYSSGTASGVVKVIAKRVDIVVDVSLNINWIRRDLPGRDELVELPQVIEVVGWHLLVSKRSAFSSQMGRLDAAIDAVRSSGVWGHLLERYGLP